MENYIDSKGEKHEHIYFHKESTSNFVSGFYFESETYDLYGPYKTFEECDQRFHSYCTLYLGTMMLPIKKST